MRISHLTIGTKLIFVLLVLVFFAISQSARADTLDVIEDISYFEETDRTYILEEILSPDVSRQFTKSHTNVLYFGLSPNAYWIKIDINPNQAGSLDQWMLELSTFKLNSIDLYYQNKSGGWDHQQAGVFTLPQKQKLNGRNFVFPIKDINLHQPIYLKTTSYYIWMPIHLWKLQDYLKKEQDHILSDGAFFGIAFAIVCYHFFIFLALRNKFYLNYAVFLAFVLLWYLSGLGWIYHYIFSEMTSPVARLAHLTSVFLNLMVMISGIQFTRIYLNISSYSPILHRSLKGFQVLLVLAAICGAVLRVLELDQLFALFYDFGSVLVVLVIILCFYSAYQGLRHNQVTARYYLIATCMQFVISIVMIFSFYKIIPLTFDWKILKWSSILEMLIFSFGLSRQVKKLNIEKQAVTEELLSAREDMISQLETINKLKDQVLSKVMESRLYPEFAKLFPIINKVIYIQALGNASRVVYLEEGMEKEIEIQSSLKDIEKCFDDSQFVRIHKTYLIRQGLKFTLQRRSSADYDLISRHAVLPVGRKYAKSIKLQLEEQQTE